MLQLEGYKALKLHPSLYPNKNLDAQPLDVDVQTVEVEWAKWAGQEVSWDLAKDLTCSRIKGVSSQSERDAALMAGEAAPMEELALSTDALQHVDPLTTEVTLLTVGHRDNGGSFGLRLRSRSRSRSGAELRGHRRHHRLREKVGR